MFPSDSNSAQSVVVRIKLRDLRDRDRARLEHHIGRECGSRCEIACRGLSLSLENEVDERRIPEARGIGTPVLRRSADWRGDVRHCLTVYRVGRS